MVKSLFQIDDDLWRVFKIVATSKGLKLKHAVPEALRLFIEKYKTEQIKLDVKVIKNDKKNLLTFVYEQEIKRLLGSLIEAKKRDAPLQHIDDLKEQTLKLLSKHPCLSQDLADEVLAVFQNLT